MMLNTIPVSIWTKQLLSVACMKW